MHTATESESRRIAMDLTAKSPKQLDQLSYLVSALIDELSGVADTDGIRMQLGVLRARIEGEISLPPASWGATLLWQLPVPRFCSSPWDRVTGFNATDDL